ncbi:uncharacterized protein M6B38_293095 [Iris pallida]|uniref:Uncharacterized protein n=1 Tax=Iris pallida TaxID=29817 RepID=A0AAX6HTY7_IRIPA|nr:uncharacterized protein M6B38_293095 [Iris pallida]
MMALSNTLSSSSSSSSWRSMITCSKTGSRRKHEKSRKAAAAAPPLPLHLDNNNNNKNLGFGSGANQSSSKRESEKWQCVRGCGACCKLDKGPAFPSPEEIFQDSDPSHLQLYKSLVGPDGWCVNYERATRTCSVYADRPSFCRVEPEVFERLYGVPRRRFNKEACSACKDTIAAVHGAGSEELDNFNRAVRLAAASRD